MCVHIMFTHRGAEEPVIYTHISILKFLFEASEVSELSGLSELRGSLARRKHGSYRTGAASEPLGARKHRQLPHRRCFGATWRSNMPPRRCFGATWRSKMPHRRCFGATCRSKSPHRSRFGATWRSETWHRCCCGATCHSKMLLRSLHRRYFGFTWRLKVPSERLFEIAFEAGVQKDCSRWHSKELYRKSAL